MRRTLKSVAKFTAVGLVCTALVGAMSNRAGTVVGSNDAAGITCSMYWCGHEDIKNIKVSSVRPVRFVEKQKLGWIVAPGQSYSVTTLKSKNTSVSTTTGINAEVLSASVGVTYQEGYSKSITISGVNKFSRDRYLCQEDYYHGKEAYLTYDRKVKQGDLFSSCTYEKKLNMQNRIGNFDSSKITLVK